MDAGTLYILGMTLIFAGILIVVVTVLLLFLSSVKKRAKIKGCGEIIIGPIPIIFGTDKESLKTILLLSLVLAVLLAIVTVVLHFISR